VEKGKDAEEGKIHPSTAVIRDHVNDPSSSKGRLESSTSKVGKCNRPQRGSSYKKEALAKVGSQPTETMKALTQKSNNEDNRCSGGRGKEIPLRLKKKKKGLLTKRVPTPKNPKLKKKSYNHT